MVITICMPPIPPDASSIAAEPEITRPQMNLMETGGFRLPLVVCMPSTNVAESAEVIKKLIIKSNATMLYGHIEKPEHIIDHLLKIRNLQKKTGGFLTLIPLKFSLENTELEQKNMLTQECSSIYDLKIIALSRLMLSGFLNNISVYWVADGKKLAQIALSHGGNDLVGTAFSEEVYRAAGKPTNSSLLDLVNLVKEIKREPAQRDTFFNILRTF